MSRAHAGSPPRHAAAGAWAGLAVGGLLLLPAAWAAPLSDPTSIRQPQAESAPGTPGRTLDRALGVDAAVGQRNLEVLLESRGAGEGVDGAGAGGLPVARRPPPQLPPLPSQGPGGADGVPPTAMPGQLVSPSYLPTQDTVSPLAGQRPDVQTVPNGPAATGGRLGAGPGQAVGERDPAERRGALSLLHHPAVQEVLEFLRTNRYWLLGALGAVLGAVALAQAYAGRASATPEARAAAAARRRADDLAGLHDTTRSRGHSRRSSEHRSAHGGDASGEHRSRRRSSRRD